MERLNLVLVNGHVGMVKIHSEKSAYFSVAIDESYKPKSATDWTQKTVWADVVVFGPVVAKIQKMGLKKGDAIQLQAKLDQTEYEGKQRVQLIGHKIQKIQKDAPTGNAGNTGNTGNGGQSAPPPTAPSMPTAGGTTEAPPTGAGGDDLPF